MNRLAKDIPKDWKAIRFDKVFDFLPTLTLSRSDLTSDEDYQGIYNIHYGDIHTTYKFVELNFDKDKSIPKITKDGIDEAKLILLKSGDIVIADASEDYEGVAACIELSNVGDRKVTAGLHTFAARDKNGFTSDGFRAYLLKHPWVKNELKKLATGSKVYGISKTNIAKLEIVLPPLPEQQKIASILCKWDELIATQTQLIKAKEKQKTSLMQKLLTGEVRFPGFKEEWEEKSLTEITEYLGGAAFKSKDQVDYGIKWLKIANVGIGKIKWDDTAYLPQSFINEFDKYRLIVGDVVMALTRPILNNKLKIARIISSHDESLLNQRVAKLIPRENNSLLYIYYLHQLQSTVDLISATIAGTDPPNIGLKELESITVPVPKIKEQSKIALVLSAIDEEIQSLKDELEAIKLQKKGLMQQLLTGKIRVKIKK